MTEILIDKKICSYSRKELPGAAKKAALKSSSEKTFTLKQARAYIKKMRRNGRRKMLVKKCSQ